MAVHCRLADYRSELLEIYGPCISTAEWTDWARHRKVVAAPFNPSTMRMVWSQSLRQTQQMLSCWTEAGGRIHSFSNDTRTLSLNVLAATGFRQDYDFQSSDQATSSEAGTYRDALQTVLDNAIFLMLVPPRVLSMPFLPSSWKMLGKAAETFRKSMLRMLEDETKLLEQGSRGTGSLLTHLLKARDSHEKASATPKTAKDSPRSKGLSEQEILGNFFVINFAGHDTTANTLAFALLLLASNPSVQDWVGEELDQLLPSVDEEWEYADLFLKVKRCHAVFLETLRLYPPILALPKWTNDHPQLLKVAGRDIVIPPRTNVSPSLLAVQTHPDYWSEPLEWKPQRWLADQAKYKEAENSDQKETLLPPPVAHTYFPWSDGPQDCPGAKFAQVEGVAVLARLLREHRVDIVKQTDDESFEMAWERALRCAEDCDMQLLLRMRDAERVKIKLRKVDA
jgi:cytochrome P450